jgi:CBS domain-containing protein
MLVKDVMTAAVLTVDVDQSITAALRLMNEHHVTSLPVTRGRSAALVGIVSEADLLRARLAHDPRAHMVPHSRATHLPVSVAQVMSRPMTVAPESDLCEAVELMVSTSVKSLPVVDQDRLVGMVSRSDVVHLLARPDDDVRRDVATLLTDAGLACRVEVADGIVSLLAPEDPSQVPAMRAVAGSVAGVVGVQVFG